MKTDAVRENFNLLSKKNMIIHDSLYFLLLDFSIIPLKYYILH